MQNHLHPIKATGFKPSLGPSPWPQIHPFSILAKHNPPSLLPIFAMSHCFCPPPGNSCKSIRGNGDNQKLLHQISGKAPRNSVDKVLIPSHSDRRKINLRTNFLHLIQRVGLKPWPPLFHNLRSSCETELLNHFSAHVVAKW